MEHDRDDRGWLKYPTQEHVKESVQRYCLKQLDREMRDRDFEDHQLQLYYWEGEETAGPKKVEEQQRQQSSRAERSGDGELLAGRLEEESGAASRRARRLAGDEQASRRAGEQGAPTHSCSS